MLSFALVAIAFVVVGGQGLDEFGAVSAGVSAISNGGPAIVDGHVLTYLTETDRLGRWLLAAVMVFGRVDILPITVLLAGVVEPLRHRPRSRRVRTGAMRR